MGSQVPARRYFDLMARVRSLRHEVRNVAAHPTEVDATFQVIQAEVGTLFHLSTYGSDSRASEPKVSQTIQLDREMAALLVAALRDAFPGL